MGPKAKPAVEALSEAVNDRDPDVRRAAGEALQQVDGTAASKAVRH